MSDCQSIVEHDVARFKRRGGSWRSTRPQDTTIVSLGVINARSLAHVQVTARLDVVVKTGGWSEVRRRAWQDVES